MRAGRRGAAIVALSLALSLVGSPAASATFHLIQVREVYPGSTANPLAEYVELQMYESGQELVGGHVLRTYDAGGSLVKANVVSSDVANGATQRTVLVATPEAESQFGVQADAALASSGQLAPAGGAVCWESLDCVSWGSFAGTTPSPSGSAADPAGVPDGMAIRRTIARGCPGLLEAADDSDNSMADFVDVFPAPRANSATPSEHPCSTQEGVNGSPEGGSPGANRSVPQTRIRQRPTGRTRDRTPTFRFASSIAGSTYLCKLDQRRFKRCRSPLTTHRLGFGHHVFAVRARAPDGSTDRSPAFYRFTVVKPGGAKR